MSSDRDARRLICDELLRHQRIVVTSHVRPDGDAIGSALAMAAALTAIGKDARVINRDPAPAPLTEFPGAADITLAESIPADAQAVVVLECGDLERTGFAGTGQAVVINIDHHQGNSGYGDVRWFNSSYAAVGEMVLELVEELGVALTPDMATQLFVAIVTDTGSFRYPGVLPRTFEMCGRLVAAGADPVLTARRLYDSNTLTRLRLQGAVLQSLETIDSGRVALLYLDEITLQGTGATPEETDGLINLPLSVKAIRAVAFFKQAESGAYRVSLRSKGEVDVGRIARAFGGGGHKNASGLTLTGKLAEVRDRVIEHLLPEVAAKTQA